MRRNSEEFVYSPPVMGYPWVPSDHDERGGHCSPHPYGASSSWYLPPHTYQGYCAPSQPAPALPNTRGQYTPTGSRCRSCLEACLEALCCCWILELCWP
eukprot:Gb_27785 [translate_table: standard]